MSLFLSMLNLLIGPAALAFESPRLTVPLVDSDSAASDTVLEAFLSPGEFAERRFAYAVEGEEAAYCLDASLSAETPLAELYPGRIRWPDIAGLPLKVNSGSLKLTRASEKVTDDDLDKGFEVRWILKPLGQRFEPSPHFAAAIVEAEVVSVQDRKPLLTWKERDRPPVCQETASKRGRPNCELDTVGLEARAVALSPGGKLLALAFGGLRPRLEVYNVKSNPRLVWQAIFSKQSGGVVETAFSSDEKWVVALTGQGRMHRFDASSGGRHLRIPSSGRTAEAVTEKRIMAVAGGLGEVRFWYLDDGTIAWQLPPRQDRGAVDRLVASGDGKRFATLEYNEKSTVLRVWEWKRRTQLAKFETDPFAVTDIALDENGETLFWSHEEKGLFGVKVSRAASPSKLKSRSARRCRSRLQWISGQNLLSCSTSKGEIRIDRRGRLKGELIASDSASEWIVSASSSGTRLAAVGGGRLLIWWTE